MSWRTELGLQIREGRLHKGWTQEVLAQAVGRGRPLISRYERGKDAPSADVLAMLAVVLGRSFSINGYEVGIVNAAPIPAPAPQMTFEFGRTYPLPNATISFSAAENGTDHMVLHATPARRA
jgi:transcriptional regulator with XRE-family HTH domain